MIQEANPAQMGKEGPPVTSLGVIGCESVWQTLTATQRQQVFESVVAVCRGLLSPAARRPSANIADEPSSEANRNKVDQNEEVRHEP